MKLKAEQTAQKLRGGYYTPPALANYIARWVLELTPSVALEPSCGDGVFIKALREEGFGDDVATAGFEINAEEAAKARSLLNQKGQPYSRVMNTCFLDFASARLRFPKDKPFFDAAFGNPPFIRYQFLDDEFQTRAKGIFDALGLPFTKLTNAWVPFVLASVALTVKGGRIGMVVPSEIIHVLYAGPLRSYLVNTCSKIVLIDTPQLHFEDALQGTVILLAQKKEDPYKPSQGVGIARVSDLDLHSHPRDIFDSTPPLLKGEAAYGKWTRGMLPEKWQRLLEKAFSSPCVKSFDEVASVEVAITTGANEFFLIDKETVDKYSLHQHVKPGLGKAQQCNGIIYDASQHEINSDKGRAAYLVTLENEKDSYPEAIQRYIEQGEDKGFDARYKCRVRSPWHKVPGAYAAPLSMPKRCHDMHRLIVNEAGALTTDTLYRVTAKEIPREILAGCFLNPLTVISAELEGRSYGGGVLELVPSEIRKLAIPVPDGIEIDAASLSAKVAALTPSELLLENGKHVLCKAGFTEDEVAELVMIWEHLKDRRQRK